MTWVYIVVAVAVIALVWWLLRRGKSGGDSMGMPSQPPSTPPSMPPQNPQM